VDLKVSNTNTNTQWPVECYRWRGDSQIMFLSSVLFRACVISILIIAWCGVIWDQSSSPAWHEPCVGNHSSRSAYSTYYVMKLLKSTCDGQIVGAETVTWSMIKSKSNSEYKWLCGIVLQSRKREFRPADYSRQREQPGWTNVLPFQFLQQAWKEGVEMMLRWWP